MIMSQIAEALLSENAAHQFGEEQFALQGVNDELLAPSEAWVMAPGQYESPELDEWGHHTIMEFECDGPAELIAADAADPDAALVNACSADLQWPQVLMPMPAPTMQ